MTDANDEDDQYHESEVVTLVGNRLRLRSALRGFMLDRGYRAEDGFYCLPRTDNVEVWQSDDVLDIDLIRDGVEIEEESDEDEPEDEWDSLQATYLMASLPRRHITRFVDECSAIAAFFQLQLQYRGANWVAGDLRAELERIAQKLSNDFAEPGAKSLQILIGLQYPKNPV